MITEKPPLTGVYLAHFGVRGMRWGHRKAATKVSSKRRAKLIENRKKRFKRLVTAGSVATAAVLYKQGKLKSTTLSGLGYTATGIGWVGGHLFTGAVNVASLGYDVVRLFGGGYG